MLLTVTCKEASKVRDILFLYIDVIEPGDFTPRRRPYCLNYLDSDLLNERQSANMEKLSDWLDAPFGVLALSRRPVERSRVS